MSESAPAPNTREHQQRAQEQILQNFEEMNLKPEVLRGVYACGFERPSSIQQLAIIPILAGQDVITESPAGTGKGTVALISILQAVDVRLAECQAVVLAPTRGLAQQLSQGIVGLGRYMDIVSYSAIGGNPVAEDVAKLREGVHIVVGTPGRVAELFKAGALKQEHLKIVCVDRPSTTLIGGFKDQLYAILQTLPGAQVVLLSATVDDAVREVSARFQHDPIHVVVNRNQEPSFLGIQQLFVSVKDEKGKLETLTDLARSGDTQVAIFCNTRKSVDELAEELLAWKIPVFAIHNSMDHDQRESSIAGFRSGSAGVFIFTDPLIGGQNLRRVPLVINYDLPFILEEYLNRLGGGGSTGASERKVISFVSRDDIPTLRQIEGFYNTKIAAFEIPLDERLAGLQVAEDE